MHYSVSKCLNNQQIINFEVHVLLIYTFRKLKILQLFSAHFLFPVFFPFLYELRVGKGKYLSQILCVTYSMTCNIKIRWGTVSAGMSA